MNSTIYSIDINFPPLAHFYFHYFKILFLKNDEKAVLEITFNNDYLIQNLGRTTIIS